MKKVVKRQWLKALRSGEYKQGNGRLYTAPQYEGQDHNFCCLGVLENLYCLKKNLTFGYGDNAYHSEKCGEWAGFPPFIENQQGQRMMDNPVAATLVEMNDGGTPHNAKSFKQIANWIEKHL